MKKLNLVVASLSVLVSIPSFADINCTAMKREMLADQTIKTTEVAIPISAGAGTNAIREVAIGDRTFTITPLQNDDYMVTITVAPDFTKGVLSTTTFTTDGHLALATVDGANVFKATCVK